MNSDCSDHVVLVTGARPVLGVLLPWRALAARQSGDRQLLAQRADAQETAEAVRGEGATPVVVKADVSNDAECQALVRAASRFGRIDALYNNAVLRSSQSIRGPRCPIGEDFLHVYHVNVVGAFQMVRAAVHCSKLPHRQAR